MKTFIILSILVSNCMAMMAGEDTPYHRVPVINQPVISSMSNTSDPLQRDTDQQMALLSSGKEHTALDIELLEVEEPIKYPENTQNKLIQTTITGISSMDYWENLNYQTRNIRWEITGATIISYCLGCVTPLIIYWIYNS